MFAAILLPLALEGPFHYSIPLEMEEHIAIGMRVLVSFGAKRVYTGIVSSLSDEPPAGVKASKTILQLLDEKPLLTANNLAFYEWMASYYLCTNGEVLRAAIPSGLLPESRTMVYSVPSFEAARAMPQADSALLDILNQQKGKAITIEELRQRLGRTALPSFTRLLEAGAIRLSEEIHYKYRPRTRRLLRLAETFRSEETLIALLDSTKRAKNQTTLLLYFIARCDETSKGYEATFAYDEISRGDRRMEAAIVALRKRGVFIVEHERISRIRTERVGAAPPMPLYGSPIVVEGLVSVYYTQDLGEKERQIERLIAEMMSLGGQVLLLSPEASRFSARDGLLSRLLAHYGSDALLYSSAVPDVVRLETYKRVASSESPLLLIGSRSGIFLPFRHLRLIIIDEEQEYGYKQQSPAPRFHARDAAIFLATICGAQVLLASECPSAETLLNMKSGKWKRVAHTTAIRPIPVLEATEVIDTSLLRKQKQMNATDLLSPPLEQAIAEALTRGQRILLIQNRRGYAAYMICTDCGRQIRCPHCDVSLTYHKESTSLICHYCGYIASMPRHCPSCKTVDRQTLRPVGYGIERAQEEVAHRFPLARIIRLDSDVALSKKRLAELHMRIEDGNVDIIIGTQMIKGQPIWRDIAVIAILRLDSLLAFPDFRSDERAFQLLFQLALRSSNSHLHPSDSSTNTASSIPRLIIQTADPEQPFVKDLCQGRYDAFIARDLQMRHLCQWPPYRRITTIIIKASDHGLVDQTAGYLHSLLHRSLGAEMISPVFAPTIARVDLQYIRHILLRRPLAINHMSERNHIRECIRELHATYPKTKRSRISFDVDPL